jgi:hypothetical protein
MSKSQNRSTRKTYVKGTMIPQKVNNHTTKDITDSEGDTISISKFKRMMIRVIDEMEKYIHKYLKEIQENTNK